MSYLPESAIFDDRPARPDQVERIDTAVRLVNKWRLDYGSPLESLPETIAVHLQGGVLVGNLQYDTYGQTAGHYGHFLSRCDALAFMAGMADCSQVFVLDTLDPLPDMWTTYQFQIENYEVPQPTGFAELYSLVFQRDQSRPDFPYKWTNRIAYALWRTPDHAYVLDRQLEYRICLTSIGRAMVASAEQKREEAALLEDADYFTAEEEDEYPSGDLLEIDGPIDAGDLDALANGEWDRLNFERGSNMWQCHAEGKGVVSHSEANCLLGILFGVSKRPQLP